MPRVHLKILSVIVLTVFFSFAYGLGVMASDDSACITCHTNSETMDALVPVITKTSTGG